MKATPIDVELMRSLLDYDPEVGGSCLVWKVNKGPRARAGTLAGSLLSTGYWHVQVNGAFYLAHRVVWAIVYGEDPSCQIDHIRGLEFGNCIENLRLAHNNESDNAQNLKRIVTNTSGYAGAQHCSKLNKWRSQISKNNKRIHLGYFDTPEEAHTAYLEAKAKLHTFNPVPR